MGLNISHILVTTYVISIFLNRKKIKYPLHCLACANVVQMFKSLQTVYPLLFISRKFFGFFIELKQHRQQLKGTVLKPTILQIYNISIRKQPQNI